MAGTQKNQSSCSKSLDVSQNFSQQQRLPNVTAVIQFSRNIPAVIFENLNPETNPETTFISSSSIFSSIQIRMLLIIINDSNRYTTSNNITREETGILRHYNSTTNIMTVLGSYSFLGDDGKVHRTRYVANENGYHPVVSSSGSHADFPLFTTSEAPEFTDNTLPTINEADVRRLTFHRF